MVKNGMSLFGECEQAKCPFFEKCAQNNAPMSSLSRIGHVFIKIQINKIQTYIMSTDDTNKYT